MYFIVSQDENIVIDYFVSFLDLRKKYSYFKYDINHNGCWIFNSENINYCFVNYKDFLDQKYQETFPNPPKAVRTCTNFLRKIKISKLLC